MKVTLKKIVFMLMIVIISMVAGCGREKQWTERRMMLTTEEGTLHTIMYLTVDIEQDMSKEELLHIVKQYERQWNEENQEEGEKSEFATTNEVESIYVVFFQNGTEKVLGKYKYEKGKFVENTDADEYIFNSIIENAMI